MAMARIALEAARSKRGRCLQQLGWATFCDIIERKQETRHRRRVLRTMAICVYSSSTSAANPEPRTVRAGKKRSEYSPTYPAASYLLRHQSLVICSLAIPITSVVIAIPSSAQHGSYQGRPRRLRQFRKSVPPTTHPRQLRSRSRCLSPARTSTSTWHHS